jgi:hypothetical protein
MHEIGLTAKGKITHPCPTYKVAGFNITKTFFSRQEFDNYRVVRVISEPNTSPSGYAIVWDNSATDRIKVKRNYGKKERLKQW